jgi:hypothetical protein
MIELEIVKRKKILLSSSDDTSMVHLMDEAETMSITLNTTLFGGANGESRMDAIKKGIKSFFFTSLDDTDSETRNDAGVFEAEHVLAEDISALIQDSVARTSRAAQRLVAIEKATRVSPDRVFQNMEESTAFELGRCDELIQQYRRIEFSTGTHRS